MMPQTSSYGSYLGGRASWRGVEGTLSQDFDSSAIFISTESDSLRRRWRRKPIAQIDRPTFRYHSHSVEPDADAVASIVRCPLAGRSAGCLQSDAMRFSSPSLMREYPARSNARSAPVNCYPIGIPLTRLLQCTQALYVKLLAS